MYSAVYMFKGCRKLSSAFIQQCHVL